MGGGGEGPPEKNPERRGKAGEWDDATPSQPRRGINFVFLFSTIKGTKFNLLFVFERKAIFID